MRISPSSRHASRLHGPGLSLVLFAACQRSVDLGVITRDAAADEMPADDASPDINAPDVNAPDAAAPDAAPLDAPDGASVLCEPSTVGPGVTDCAAMCGGGATPVDGCCLAWRASWVADVRSFRVVPSAGAPRSEQLLAAYTPSRREATVLNFYRAPGVGVGGGYEMIPVAEVSLMTTFAVEPWQALALYDRSSGSATLYRLAPPPEVTTALPVPVVRAWGANHTNVLPLTVDGATFLLGLRAGSTEVPMRRVRAADLEAEPFSVLRTERPFDEAQPLDSAGNHWLVLRDEALGEVRVQRVELSATMPRAPTGLRPAGLCITDGMPGTTLLLATWATPPDETSGREFVLYSPDSGVAYVRQLDATGTRIERSRALRLVPRGTHVFLYRRDGVSRIVVYGEAAERASSYRYAPW